MDRTNDLTAAWSETANGAVIELARKSDSRQELMGRFQWIFTLALPPLALLGFLTGAIMARRSTRPLQHLATVVRSIIETGRMDVRVPARRASDELSDLIVLFNQMLDRNEALLKAMKESLDNVAHDVRTPLTRLRFVAEQALETHDLPETCEEPLRECLTETEHIQTIIQTLLEVARAEGGVLNLNRKIVEAAPLVQDAVELYEHVAAEKEIALTFASRARLPRGRGSAPPAAGVRQPPGQRDQVHAAGRARGDRDGAGGRVGDGPLSRFRHGH